MATSRPSFVSRARNTSPMPPSPICASTSYAPRRVPEIEGQARGLYGRATRRGREYTSSPIHPAASASRPLLCYLSAARHRNRLWPP